MMAHMLFIPFLARLVRDQTSPAFTPDNSLDTDYSSALDLFSMAMGGSPAITLSDVSVRSPTQDTDIAGKRLRKCNMIKMPQCQLHYDINVFGDDSEDVNADRFVKNENHKRTASCRPFGDGTTLCPDRPLAKQTSSSLIALLPQHPDAILDPSS
jgi:hypothetical protein